jgi:hypothetical protein
MAQNINVKYTSYTFTNTTIHDADQLDGFLSTYMPSSTRYNSLYYDAIPLILMVNTTEPTSVTGTRTIIENLLLKYGNPEPLPQSRHGVALVNKGDLATYDVDRDINIRIPVGLPGQVLTVEPTSTSGFAWRALTNDVSSGMMTSATDAYIRYADAFDDHGGTVIAGTDTDLPLTVQRRLDAPTFEHAENSPTITITEAGNYWMYFNGGFEWIKSIGVISRQNTQIVSKILIDKNDGNGYQVQPGSESWYLIPISLPNAQNSHVQQFGLEVTNPPWHIKAVAKDLKTTNLVVTSGGMVNIGMAKMVIDSPVYDDSALFGWAKTSDQVIDPTMGVSTIVTFNQITCNTNTGYTINGNSEVVALRSAGHFIVPTLTFQTFDGTSSEEIVVETKIQRYSSSVWTDVPLSSNLVTLHVGADESEDVCQATYMLTGQILTSEKLRIVCTIVSRGPNIQAKIIGNGTRFSLLSVMSSRNGIDNIDATQMLCTNPIALEDQHWTDAPWDMVIIENDNYTLDELKTTIQNSENGTYVIMFKCDVQLNTTDPSRMCNVKSRFVVNSGAGFFEAAASYGAHTLQGGHKTSLDGQSMMYMGYNYNVKLQVIINDVGNLNMSQDTVTIVPYTTTLLFAKFEDTMLSLAAPGILVFGSYYHYHEDLEVSSSTSTAFITKSSLITNVLPKGKYRLNIYYEWYMSSTSALFKNLVALNEDINNPISSFESLTTITDNVTPRNTYLVLQLNQGIHSFEVDWCSGDSAVTASILNLRMELYRVG